MGCGWCAVSVLIGCEYSAVVRDAFRSRGFDAWSNDLKACEADSAWHIQSDVRLAISSRQWDLIVLHVECTAMAVSGNRHYGMGTTGYHKRLSAVAWSIETILLARQYSKRVAVENPASVIFPILRTSYGADVQYIQPWEHGHPEQKKTGFALWNLPRIEETNNVFEHMMTLPKSERERIFYMSPGAQRGHERSRFLPGVAAALADQWGAVI